MKWKWNRAATLAVCTLAWAQLIYWVVTSGLLWQLVESNFALREAHQVEQVLFAAAEDPPQIILLGDGLFLRRAERAVPPGTPTLRVNVPRPDADELADVIRDGLEPFRASMLVLQASPHFFADFDPGIENSGPAQRLELWENHSDPSWSPLAGDQVRLFFSVIEARVRFPKAEQVLDHRRPQSLMGLRFDLEVRPMQRLRKAVARWTKKSPAWYVADRHGLDLASNPALATAFDRCVGAPSSCDTGAPVLELEEVRGTLRRELSKPQ